MRYAILEGKTPYVKVKKIAQGMHLLPKPCPKTLIPRDLLHGSGGIPIAL
jgi:hypothetical protein